MKFRSFQIRLTPTPHLLTLIGIATAVLFAALHYENNLAYLALAMVISITLVSIAHTYRNLSGVEISVNSVAPVFAGDTVLLVLHVHNHNSIPCYSLFFDTPGAPLIERPTQLDFVSAANNHLFELRLDAPKRGWHRIAELHVSSTYPFGLFRASFQQTIQLDYLVYPKPKSLRPWTESVLESSSADQVPQKGGDDFYGWKTYQHGDSLHHVNWKAFARGRPLLVKEYAGNSMPIVWLDWHSLDGLDNETKLSQMAFWTLQAHQQGIPFGMRLPKLQIPPGSGNNHYHECLRALALCS